MSVGEHDPFGPTETLPTPEARVRDRPERAARAVADRQASVATLPGSEDRAEGSRPDASVTGGREGERDRDTADLPLGPHRLEGTIGAGGMGKVFVARDTRTDQRVALKTLVSTTATRLYRFKREFRALADVTHRNLVQLYELVVPDRGPAYFTMELLRGRPFVDWVRGTAPVGTPPDLDRLEHGLRQLVEGVGHLHAHGCIHRDLKPSNVLVTTDGDDAGRVVILDFGLVSEQSEPDHGVTRDQQILGTPAYMAPEQAAGGQVGAAADYYAIGVMLYECLTGQLPHRGGALQQIVDKQGSAILDPGAEVEVPERLRTLCMRLLTRDPAARPGPSELLATVRAPLPRTVARPDVFVGRTEELQRLQDAAHEVVAEHRAVVVHLRGRSGDGKSTLVRRFRSQLVDQARPDGARVVVLTGRCREREDVPYKGIDAVVDALSAYLRRLPDPERARLQPPDLDVLVRMFPVLDEIWPSPEPQKLGLDEIRRLGAVTLRKLVERVARSRPLVVHIDDFQWADLDSVHLLEALLRPPDPPAMLLLLAYRSEAEGSAALQGLHDSEVLGAPPARTIELRALPDADARALARALLPAARDDATAGEAGPARAETIALRSRGSPFFIVQMALGRADADSHGSDLDQYVVERLADLDDARRRLLEVVAVFGGPLSIGRAAALGAPADEATVDGLCARGLLVRAEGGADEDVRIEVAHDRVREVVLDALPDERRIRLHRTIGEHLLAESLARHHGEEVKDDGLFAIVNHLDAGMGERATLDPQRRRQLAELNNRAGQRALASTAWIAAQRYLGCARELIDPWLADAREGRGHHELCVEVVFGWGQTRINLGDPDGDGVLEDLLQWTLSIEDYCRIAEWYSVSLGVRLRSAERIEFSMGALARLGIRAPRRPSWPRALASYLLGWWTIRRVGPERLRALPPIEDPRVRVGLEILGGIASNALSLDFRLHLALVGRYCRLLPRHGFHDGAVGGLALLAISAAARGKIDEAQSLFRVSDALAEAHDASAFIRHGAQAMRLMALPLYRPIAEVVAHGEQACARAREVAPRPLAEMMAYLHLANCYCAGTSLPRLEQQAHDATHAHGNEGLSLAWVTDTVTLFRRFTRVMIEGRAAAVYVDGISHGLASFDDNPMYLAGAVMVELAAAVLLGDHARGWTLAWTLAHDYRRVMLPTWNVPMSAMLGVVVVTELSVGEDGRSRERPRRQRRRMRRVLRQSRATARQWAQRCPENYQPMLEVIEGEIAATHDRYGAATAAYERARAIANEHGVTWLAAFASERLGRLAERHGHALVADAAFAAAREGYERWGATAVVRRLEGRGRATSEGASGGASGDASGSP